MRLHTLAVHCAALVNLASASSSAAYLWTVDLQTTKYANEQVESASSETASAILARRRGMHDSAYLITTDESILADINQFGGFQQPLYGAGFGERSSKLFVRMSGYDGSVSQFDALPDLWIEDPKQDLLDDFQARTDIEGICEYDISRKDVNIIYTYTPEDDECMSVREVKQLPTIMALYATLPTSKTIAGRGITNFLRTLIHFQATSNIESTVLVLPSPSKLVKASKKPVKRSSEAAAMGEELLEIDPVNPTASKSSSPSSINTFANKTKPLPAIIPQCFKSNDTCMETTNACSGHGACYKAHANCFKCRCGTTVVRENDDGTKKTVQWGGNACQKKDVSIPFFLFASFGVVFTAIVAGAIGMLYSMGSQELPSVIGAGVVGPRAQK